MLTLNNKNMNTLNKLMVLFFTVFMFIPKGYSQNADPGIGVLMTPSSVTQGATGILSANVGNYSNGTIVENSLSVAISVGANAEIIGVAAGSDTRWSQLSMTAGAANTIKLTNTGGSFGSFDLGKILLTVRGNEVSDANGIIGNIIYVTANNPLLCGGCPSPAPLNASQGNANNSNDNASTSVTVTTLLSAEDDISQTPVNISVAGNVVTNDIGPAGDILVVNTTPMSGPVNGTLVLNADGTYTYTPNTSFIGEDSFVYQVCDAGSPVACATASVVITVTGPFADGNFAPVVQDDNATTETNMDVAIHILANDTDPDGTIDPTSVSLDASTIPSAICTSTVGGDCLVVTVPNEGTYTLDPATGVVIFDPEPSFTGETTPLGYTVCDDTAPTALCDDATIKVVVSERAVNEMTAEDDANIGFAGDTLSANILSNDIDPDGSTGAPDVESANAASAVDGSYGPLTLGTPTVIYGSDANNLGNFIVAGTLTLNADGSYSYDADLDFLGTVYVTYTTCDNDVDTACDSATLYLTTLLGAIPDATLIISAAPNVMHGLTNFYITVRVTELNSATTNGVITVKIPKDTRWILDGAYDPGLTTLGTTTLNNSEWEYTQDSTTHIFETVAGGVITADGFSYFGFNAIWDPGQTKGVFTMTSQIQSFSGGEDNIGNNVDSESLNYFIE
jgi:CshA-type fibril repeat protein